VGGVGRKKRFCAVGRYGCQNDGVDELGMMVREGGREGKREGGRPLSCFEGGREGRREGTSILTFSLVCIHPYRHSGRDCDAA